MTTATWPLVGREHELEALLAVTEGKGSAVVVGGLGVGKSHLVAKIVHNARQNGVRTVDVRATRSMATIPFGPFADWAPEVKGDGNGERLQVLQGIAATLGRRGNVDGGPLLVAVDDAHLLDDGSAALIYYLAAHTAMNVVAAVRSGKPCLDAIRALWKENLADRIELHPLTRPKAAELLGRVLDGPVAPAVERRLWRLTKGTPLYLREVIRAAIDGGVLVRGDEVWRWQGELTGRGRLAELVRDRLFDEDTDERRALEWVAIAEPLPVELAGQLGCLTPLAEAERQGLVVTEESAIRLAHPLYTEVLRADMPALARASHHLSLAKAAVALGWQQRDPLRVALWWLESGKTPRSADLFMAAANQALALGEWMLADRLGRTAEALGAEPEASVVRIAAAVHLSGWGQAAILSDAPDEALSDDLKAQHVRLRAGHLAWSEGDLPAGRDLLTDAATRLVAPARARVLLDAAYIAIAMCQPTEAARLSSQAMNDAGEQVQPRIQAIGITALALVLQGRAAAARQLSETALAPVASTLNRHPHPSNPATLISLAQCFALVWGGRLDDAAAAAAAALKQSQRDGLEASQAVEMSMTGRVALLQGRLPLARRCGQEALLDSEPGPMSVWPAAITVASAAQLGDVAAAEAALARVAEVYPTIPILAHELELARAWLVAAHGDLRDARTITIRVASDATATGTRLVEMLALLELTRLGGAKMAAPRLLELCEGIDGTFIAAAAEYASAAAADDGPRLDAASKMFEEMGALLLAAETAALAARSHQSEQRRQASRARARRLVARCGGARTPALQGVDVDAVVEGLTRRELDVAELAGRGLSNREIASRLHISVRTVNAHLNHAYTKIGISDRSRLLDMLSDHINVHE